MTYPPCQLCGVNPASCKAHIIPKQFYKRIRGDAPHLLDLNVEEKVNQRFSQSGVKEQGILCTDCDRKLGVFDRYGYSVLPEKIVQNKITITSAGVNIYDLGLVDIKKFKLFLIALVWRASQSSHPLFQAIKIGPYEEKFQNILSGKDNLWLERIDCVIVHFKPPMFNRILFRPFHDKCEDINVIQFYLYPWKLVIKLDGRPFGNSLNHLALKNLGSTYALMISTLSKGELKVLANLQKKLQASNKL
ncbi:MAG TPA: hypothetical protein VHY30_00250 [Verrucomicrobiae bacterium]|nr:hypothetical protein [Verrucomicrobiae bacterium]